MKAEIKEALGVEAATVVGSGGIFRVVVDGDVVYDRGETFRFPHPGEIKDLIRSR